MANNEISYKTKNGNLVGHLEEAAFIGTGVGNGTGNGVGTGISNTNHVEDGISKLDIAQSHHFTVSLEGFTQYLTPQKTFSKFLPVKSINLVHTSYESMSIPLAIFGDFPLLNRKRLASIALTCFDLDNNKLEKELMVWEAQCFPKNKFVAYMSDIAREFIYRGYNVKGQQTIERRMFVIPSGGVSVGRDYSANDAKLISFNLIAVGNGANSASGLADVPVLDHGGGLGTLGSFATAYISGINTSRTV